MAKGFVNINVGPTKETKRLLEMVRHYPERIKAVRAEFTREVAEDVLGRVKRSIPSSRDYKDYKDSLRVSQVKRMSGVEDVYTVDAAPGTKKTEQLSPKNTILIVKPKMGAKGALGKIRILQKHNPWTADTIPFYPSVADALVISRKVRPQEVAHIRNKRNRDSSKWRSELASVGAAERKTGRITRTARSGKSVPDVAFQALRLEFGMGGSKARAHWRPAILEMTRRTLPKKFKKRTKFDKAMSDPRNVEWVSWPKRTGSTLQEGDVRRFKEFQDKLGLRMRL